MHIDFIMHINSIWCTKTYEFHILMCLIYNLKHNLHDKHYRHLLSHEVWKTFSQKIKKCFNSEKICDHVIVFIVDKSLNWRNSCNRVRDFSVFPSCIIFTFYLCRCTGWLLSLIFPGFWNNYFYLQKLYYNVGRSKRSITFF